MEFLTKIAVNVSLITFLAGFLITAVSGSARAIRYFLAALTGIFILATIAGFILSRGLIIFLLPQLIVLLILIFFVIIAGAACGGGLYVLIHKKSRGGKLSAQEIEDYLPISEFSEIEGITEERALGRIKNGFYHGGRYEGGWYVHKSELS